MGWFLVIITGIFFCVLFAIHSQEIALHCVLWCKGERRIPTNHKSLGVCNCSYCQHQKKRRTNLPVF